MLLRFENVGFGYETSASTLFENISQDFSPGWTGIVGANGSGKTTLLRLACRDLAPQTGVIRSSGKTVFCPQRTDDAPQDFDTFIQAMDRTACRLRGQLRITDDWKERWSTLSHGERKRAQIGVALWLSADILAIDEPTNHVDAEARALIHRSLSAFEGIGLLVSHDRTLLDALCHGCLFAQPPRVVCRSGGYSRASTEIDKEQTAQKRLRNKSVQALAQLEKERGNRKQKAAGADRKRSKRGIAKNDHDAREKANRARVTGRDGRAGRLASQLEGRTEKLRQTLEQTRTEKQYQTGIWLEGAAPRQRTLVWIPAGTLPLGGDRWLHHPTLRLTSDDRVGITGRNGAGKSTLVEHLLSRVNLPNDAVVYIPQEISVADARGMMARVRELSREDLGHIMTVVSRLGTRPERLLETALPSPGEIRKVMLALGIIRDPSLVIMDEPTNHLDLPAIECLEEALRDCPCGLLLVSHDDVFLDTTTRTQWHIRQNQLWIDDN